LVASGVAKKYVGADLSAKHWDEPPGGALCGGVDGPRPKRRSGSFSAYVRTVRDGAEGRLLRSRSRSRLPGGTLSGKRNLRVCLGVSRAPKTSLVDVETKRGENSRWRKAKLGLN
jgi:hypothetical protein